MEISTQEHQLDFKRKEQHENLSTTPRLIKKSDASPLSKSSICGKGLNPWLRRLSTHKSCLCKLVIVKTRVGSRQRSWGCKASTKRLISSADIRSLFHIIVNGYRTRSPMLHSDSPQSLDPKTDTCQKQMPTNVNIQKLSTATKLESGGQKSDLNLLKLRASNSECGSLCRQHWRVESGGQDKVWSSPNKRWGPDQGGLDRLPVHLMCRGKTGRMCGKVFCAFCRWSSQNLENFFRMQI